MSTEFQEIDGKYFKSTKSFYGFPCTHRGWKGESHCRFIHGYSREFHFEFSCHELTKEGWVVDFGGLTELKSWLDDNFDHTFLAASDDPHLELFKQMQAKELIQLRILPNIGMEGTAVYVYDNIKALIERITAGRAWISKIEVRENEKNSGIYTPINK